MKILKYYRISDWYYYLGFIMLGFTLNSLLNINIIRHLLFGSFLLAYAYSLNNFYDKHEKKKFFILPLILSILLFSFFNVLQIIISLVFLIIVTLYSAYPLRWKSKPIISSLCNGIGFTIIFLLGYFYAPIFALKGLLFTVLFFSLNMVAQFIHETVDMREDKINNNITTAVFFGEKNVKKYCYFFLSIALLTGLYLFILKAINALFLSTISFFTMFFIFEIKRRKIGAFVRKEYKFLGILFGTILFLLTLI